MNENYRIIYRRHSDIEGWITGSLCIKCPDNGTAEKLSVYLGKDGIPKDGYTPLVSVDVSSGGAYYYDIPDGVYPPDGADELILKRENGDEAVLDICKIKAHIPQLDSRRSETVFGVFTDIHIDNSDPEHLHNKHYTAALTSLMKLASKTDIKALFTVGDNTNHGKPEQWEHLMSMTDEVCGKSKLPIYWGLGNHEYMYGEFAEQLALYLKMSGSPSLYRKISIDGYSFLMLAAESPE